MKPAVVDDCQKCGACCRFLILAPSAAPFWKNFEILRPVNFMEELHILNPDFPLRGFVLTLKHMIEEPSSRFQAFSCRLLRFDGERHFCDRYEDRPEPCRSYPEPGTKVFAAPHCTFRKLVEDVDVVDSVEEARERNRRRFLEESLDEELDFPALIDKSFAPFLVNLADEYLVRIPVNIIITSLYKRRVPYNFPKGTGLKLFAFLLEHGIPVKFFFDVLKQRHPHSRYSFFPPAHIAFSRRTFDLVLEEWIKVSGL